jgi:hypothetical protein
MAKPQSTSHVFGSKISKFGIAAIGFCTVGFAVPFHAPLCLLMPVAFICALTCSIVAAVKGSKYWLILSVISAILVAQTILAVTVEC